MFDPNAYGTAEPAGMSPPTGYPPIDQPDVHLLDRLSILYKYRRIVFTVLALVLIASLVDTYTTTPLYRATAQLMIEEDRPKIAGLGDAELYTQDSDQFYQTQFRILQSRELARKVVEQLDLANVPEFNGQGPQPTGLSAAAESARRTIRRGFASITGAKIVDTGVATKRPTNSQLVDAFLARVRIQPVTGSHVVSVQFTSATAEFAARAANSLANAYVEQNLFMKKQQTEKTLDWLTSELVKAKQKVEQTERNLSDYRERENALSLSDRQDIVISRLNTLNEAVTRARLQRDEKETAYQQIKDVSPEDPAADTYPAIASNTLIQTLKGQLADLQQQKIKLSDRYGEKHPELVRTEALIADTQKRLRAETARIIESIRNDYNTAVAAERTLLASLNEQKATAMDLNRKAVGYKSIENEAQSGRTLYEQLLKNERELRVAGSSKENNAQLMDQAEPPSAPYTPNPQRNLLLALGIGIALGVGLAFGLDYLDDTIKTPEDITRKLKIPFLGLVPAVRGERLPVLSGPVPHDFGEAYRALRTSLVFTNGGDSTRLIAVTSTQPLEGKTTTACNLGMVLAIGGARVLLIDADMRRPGVHKVMQLPNSVGLSHLLVGQSRVREAIQRTSDPNLLVLTAGRTPPNPSELLASDKMKNLLVNLASGPFDWVIIDTPPILAVTDAVILTPWVSGVTFVLGADMTRRRLAERAVQILMASKPRVLGAVLNRVNFDRNKYYYSRYYGHQYKSYYTNAAASA